MIELERMSSQELGDVMRRAGWRLLVGRLPSGFAAEVLTPRLGVRVEGALSLASAVGLAFDRVFQRGPRAQS